MVLKSLALAVVGLIALFCFQFLKRGKSKQLNEIEVMEAEEAD